MKRERRKEGEEMKRAGGRKGDGERETKRRIEGDKARERNGEKERGRGDEKRKMGKGI